MRMRTCLLLVVICGIGATPIDVKMEKDNGTRLHCSSPTGSVDGRIVVEKDGGALEDFTTLSWHVGLGETLCYKFSSEKSGLRGTVEVTYVSIKTLYSITDSYQFHLGQGEASCHCDCPGGASHCSPATDNCEGSKNCVNYYNPSVTAKGCFFNFLKLSAALCCSIQVSAVPRQKYRALHLGVPSVMAEFETRYRDEEGRLVDTRTHNIDLNSGSTIDWEVSLQVSSPGPTNSLPSGWYVSPSHQQTLISGLAVNPLDGWDINKVGWLKEGPRGGVVTHGLEQLLSVFSPKVEDCVAGKYTATFSSGIINKDRLSDGRQVQDVFSFVKKVRVWRRHVEVRHKESPLLSLTLQHRSRVGVVIQYSQSQIQDFSGILYQDPLSHLFLNLSLVGVAGTITGLVTGPSFSQTVQLHLSSLSTSSSPVNTTRQVRLTGLDCGNGQVTVTLRPLGQSDRELSRQLPCVTENLRMWRSVANLSIEVQGQAVKDCLTCNEAWLYWLDPSHWMDTGWSTIRVISLVLTLAMGLVVLLVLCKVARVFCKCWDKQ